MSQEMISQKIRRTCDACGAIKEWELIGVDEPTVREMEEWYTVIREVFVDGHFVKIMTQSCSLACVPAVAVKLALPKVTSDPNSDADYDAKIDLASLRQGNNEVN